MGFLEFLMVIGNAILKNPVLLALCIIKLTLAFYEKDKAGQNQQG